MNTLRVKIGKGDREQDIEVRRQELEKGGQTTVGENTEKPI